MCKGLRTAGYVWPVKSAVGFTLIEFLLVLTLLAFSTIAVAQFSYWLDQSKVDTVILNLRAALYAARAEAITRGGRVVICRRNGSLQQCAGSSATGKPSWSAGWLMYWDADADKQLDQSQGDLILRVYPSSGPRVKLHWNRGDYIAYQQSGRLASLNGTFCIGIEGGEGSMKELAIPYTGRVRVSSNECSYELQSL